MDNFLIRLVCCFIPNRDTRHLYRRCTFGKYNIIGNNNRVLFLGQNLPRFLKIRGVNIEIIGNNNTIKIGKPRSNFKNCKFIIHANNANYEIKNVNFMHDVLVFSRWGDNQSFCFGDDSDVNGMEVFLMEQNAAATIGDHTIMSTDIVIRPTDIHTLIDNKTGEVINSIKHKISIGNHCWISQGVTLLKGAIVPDDCVVGANSLVTKEFKKSHTVIAGNPAKEIREDVSWSIETPYAYIHSK